MLFKTKKSINKYIIKLLQISTTYQSNIEMKTIKLLKIKRYHIYHMFSHVAAVHQNNYMCAIDWMIARLWAANCCFLDQNQISNMENKGQRKSRSSRKKGSKRNQTNSRDGGDQNDSISTTSVEEGKLTNI